MSVVDERGGEGEGDGGAVGQLHGVFVVHLDGSDLRELVFDVDGSVVQQHGTGELEDDLCLCIDVLGSIQGEETGDGDAL